MLSTVLLVACVACVIVAQVFILRSALGTAVIDHEDAHVPRPRRSAEIAWAVLPAIALMLVLWATWQESRATIEPPAPMPGHAGHGAHAS
ncbi:MAG TPA: hypothetical protein VFH14_03990 [Gemmatimonadaceae bacterium]|nr:hypothetical protein [Gemmatimonadaceae bacterium]